MGALVWCGDAYNDENNCGSVAQTQVPAANGVRMGKDRECDVEGGCAV